MRLLYLLCLCVTHLGESNFEDEPSHLGDARGTLLEALQIVSREHKVTLLPTGEYPVALGVNPMLLSTQAKIECYLLFSPNSHDR